MRSYVNNRGKTGNMKFNKGESGNPTGRPKGTENAATGLVRALWKDLMLENIEVLKEDFKALEPKERLAVAVKISNFILPRLQSIESSNYPDWAELLMLPPEERTQEILKLKREIEGNEGTGSA